MVAGQLLVQLRVIMGEDGWMVPWQEGGRVVMVRKIGFSTYTHEEKRLLTTVRLV